MNTSSLVRSDIWYSDGNIVLQAEKMQFRVHKSMLAKHSSVFNDMFTMASEATDDMDNVEGCAVVLLYDRAEDVAHLLRAIYDPIHYFVPRDRIPLDVLSSVIRLGKKYGVQDFYSRAVACFVDELPSTLERWDAVRLGWLSIEYHKGIMLDIIALARSANILCVLPQALCRARYNLDIQNLMHGTDDNGARAEGLNPDDLLLCLSGWTLYSAESSKILQNIAEDIRNNLSCAGSDLACAAAIGHLIVRFLKDFVGFSFDILTDEWDDGWAEGLCESCTDRFYQLYQTARKDLWDRLPSFYGLPSWDELRAQSDL